MVWKERPLKYPIDDLAARLFRSTEGLWTLGPELSVHSRPAARLSRALISHGPRCRASSAAFTPTQIPPPAWWAEALIPLD